MYELRLRSASENETRAIGEAVASLLATGDVVGLTGDLGAGKTRLVQGASAALGVDGPVVSPTFMLVREYDGELPINHVDAYRLDGSAELEDLGLDGVLDPDAVVFVEWADRVEGALGESWLEIRLVVSDDETRDLTFRPHGRSWHDRAEALQTALAPFVVKLDG